jgi:hypothetical protein
MQASGVGDSTGAEQRGGRRTARPARLGLTDDTPAGMSASWAVWNAWRGDARVVRATVHELEQVSGAQVSCSIEIAVKGDVQRFTTADGWLEHATAQALRSFSSFTITAAAGDAHAVSWSPASRAAVERGSRVRVLVVTASGPARGGVGAARDVRASQMRSMRSGVSGHGSDASSKMR